MKSLHEPLVMWFGLVVRASIWRCCFFNLHVWIVKHHMNYNAQPIHVHLTFNTNTKTIAHGYTSVDMFWLYLKRKEWMNTWNVQGFFSCISMQRKPEVLLSPMNLVPSGKRLRSIPLPQSTRHSPCIMEPWYLIMCEYWFVIQNFKNIQ